MEEEKKVFLRQMQLKDWDQTKISGKKVLLLGVGGVGATTAMDICRLGYKSMILLDFDEVEEHNLNRQVLYSRDSIGKRKVDEAFDELQRIHNPSGIELTKIHVDGVKKWDVVVDCAKKCDVIVNTIDYGDYYDAAVSALADSLDIPMVLGGTEPFYGHTVSLFFQPDQDHSYLHYHDLSNPDDVLSSISKEKIQSLNDLSFLPQDVHPDVGGSCAYSAGIIGHLCASAITQHFLGRDVPRQTILNLMSWELNQWY